MILALYYGCGLRKNEGVNVNASDVLLDKDIIYDPVIGGWNTVDPKVEIDRRWSPYGYGFNDPNLRTGKNSGVSIESSARVSYALLCYYYVLVLKKWRDAILPNINNVKLLMLTIVFISINAL